MYHMCLAELLVKCMDLCDFWVRAVLSAPSMSLLCLSCIKGSFKHRFKHKRPYNTDIWNPSSGQWSVLRSVSQFLTQKPLNLTEFNRLLISFSSLRDRQLERQSEGLSRSKGLWAMVFLPFSLCQQNYFMKLSCEAASAAPKIPDCTRWHEKNEGTLRTV